MSIKIASIHQPDFFPWLGLFDKVNRSDVFIILDHVENNPRDPLWTKRVQIICNKKLYWLTIPLEHSKELLFQPINQMRISNVFKHQKHLQTIKQNYKKAPFFDEVFPFIEKFYLNKSSIIADRNIQFISDICELLEINTIRFKSSDYNFTNNSNELLVEIIKYFYCNTYIHGTGALNYQRNDVFYKENIKLIYQNFNHPIYNQFNADRFYPGLSIIDPLMNLGAEGVKILLATS